MSAPEAIQRAECKLLQLRAAVELGLPIPNTLVTNDAEALRQFRAAHPRGVIVKAIASPLLSELNQFVFTHHLEEHLDLCDLEVQLAPFICQEAVAPKRDVRVAVVGERYFAAELESAQDDHIDWRVGPKDRPWRPIEIPADLGEKLVRLVAKLNLAYAGIDLLHHDKGFCFIEANPNGEWGWLRAGAGLPIDEALAEYLIG